MQCMAALDRDVRPYFCNVANPDPEHCSDANQEASSACNANAEFKSTILDVIAIKEVSWFAK